MLVLTRRVSEEIVIDENIRIKVTAIGGNRVRLGISAPPWVRIDRQEVHAQRSDPKSASVLPKNDASPVTALIATS